jgi:hypothetical protein
LCLKTPDNRRFVFYQESTDEIAVDLSAMSGAGRAVAVDTTREYREIELRSLRPEKQTIKLPRRSDWAVAVGERRP